MVTLATVMGGSTEGLEYANAHTHPRTLSSDPVRAPTRDPALIRDPTRALTRVLALFHAP